MLQSYYDINWFPDIAHRDLKPANILCEKLDEVSILYSVHVSIALWLPRLHLSEYVTLILVIFHSSELQLLQYWWLQ